MDDVRLSLSDAAWERLGPAIQQAKRPVLDEHRDGQEGTAHVCAGGRRVASFQSGLQAGDVDFDAGWAWAGAVVYR